MTEEIARLLTELRADVNDLSGRVRAQGEVLAALEGLTTMVHGLADTVADLQIKVGLDDTKGKGYKPHANPRWWSLGEQEKDAEVGRLKGWYEQIARPFLGVKGVPECVSEHDVTLLYLDAACELWKVLWLPEGRSASTVAGQAEFLTRVWPSIRADIIKLMSGCEHQAGLSTVRGAA